LNKFIERDEKIVKIFEKYDVENSSELKLLGLVKSVLNTKRRDLKKRESNFCNLIADSLKNYLNIDFSIINSGIFKGDNIYFEGYLFSSLDLHIEIPTNPKVVIVEVTGSFKLTIGRDLKNCIEKSLFKYPEPSKTFLHFSSGIKLIFDYKKSPKIIKLLYMGKYVNDDDKFMIGTLEDIYEKEFFDSKLIEYDLELKNLNDISEYYIVNNLNSIISCSIEERIVELNYKNDKNNVS
jgi:hypothetical protein